MKLKQRQIESFSDGNLTLMKGSERKKEEIVKKNIRYGERTVGVQRYFRARVINNEVDKLIAIPKNPFINRKQQIVLEDGEHYKIIQMQYKEDSIPPSIYLTLEKVII